MPDVTAIGLLIDPLVRSYRKDFFNQLSPGPNVLDAVGLAWFSLRNSPWGYTTLGPVMIDLLFLE